MLIRTAQEKDIPYIVQLQRQLLDAHREFDGPYYELEDNFDELFAIWVKEQLNSPMKVILVAEENNEAVGFISGYIKTLYPWFRIKSVGHIAFLSVHPDHRRKKIGQELEEKIIDWFKSQNVSFIEVFVDELNLIGCLVWNSYSYRNFKKFLRKII